MVIIKDPFYRKLWRDLWLMRGQALAIVLVIAAGVSTYVMARCTLVSLKRAQETYYSQYRFAEVFTHLKRAPRTLEQRISEIPGIAQVLTRIVVTVKVDMPGLIEPATAKLISIPEREPPPLNQLHLRTGRYIEPGRPGEVLISEGFAKSHRLVPGNLVRVIINGRLRELTIVGVALSPEFIFQIREGDVMPDDRRYGVFWMGETELAAAFDLQGAFNDVVCSLSGGANEADVLKNLDDLTEPYGGLGAMGRTDQSSHEFVTNEMQELRGMAVVVPTIFLGISAFLLNMVVSRLIAMQREQIAALKAFGYTPWEIGWHYTQLVMLFVVLGVVVGALGGFYFGVIVTRMYTRFFHFPVFAFTPDYVVVLSAFGISSAAAILGTLTAVRRAVSLPPAEAMRPEPPARFGPSFMERLGPGRSFSEPVKLIFRQLERAPVKSALTCCGIALAVAVLILGSFMLDAINYAINAQYNVAMREDLSVLLIEPGTTQAMHAIDRLPGIRLSEPMRVVPTRLSFGSRFRRLAVIGLSDNAELHRLMDINSQRVALPPEGIVLSKKLGEVLGVQVGNTLLMEVLEGRRTVVEVPVTGLITDFAGTAAYMDRKHLNQILQEGDIVSGAFVAADSGSIDSLYLSLKNAPRVASVNIKGSALKSFRDTVARNLLLMRTFVVSFAAVITVGVVFNSTRISLAERSRELATLRVIGFTRRETSLLLLGELGLLVAIAIPLGLVMGYGLAAFLIRFSYDTELFRMPLVINRSTYGFAAVATLLSALGSALVVRHLLDRLDLVAVLKTRE